MSSKGTSKRKSGASDQTLPAAKRMRSSFSETLTVIVGKGDSTQTFLVHKDLIINQSKFFKAATSTQAWTEAIEKTIKIPEHEPRTFQAYVEYLYNADIDLGAMVIEAAEACAENNMEKGTPLWASTRLAEGWVLGDYIGDAKFQNKVIKTFQKLSRSGHIMYQWRTIRYIVATTACTSGLYRLVVGLIVANLKFCDYTEEKSNRLVENLPDQMAKEVLKRMVRATSMKKSEVELDSVSYLENEEI